MLVKSKLPVLVSQSISKYLQSNTTGYPVCWDMSGNQSNPYLKEVAVWMEN